MDKNSLTGIVYQIIMMAIIIFLIVTVHEYNTSFNF